MLRAIWTCAECGEPVHRRDVHRQMNVPGWDLAGPVAEPAAPAEPAEAQPNRRRAERRRLTDPQCGDQMAIEFQLTVDGLDHYAITLADPEGNEFCLH